MLDTSLKSEAERLTQVANEIIAGYEKRCEELSREMEEANELVRKTDKGDARENADLQAAREHQAMVNHMHTTTYKQLIAMRSCIEDYTPRGVITIGTTVDLHIISVNGEHPNMKQDKFIMKLVEHDASDAERGFVAVDSAVGSCIIGKVAGDTVSVKTPMGVIQYKIERIY